MSNTVRAALIALLVIVLIALALIVVKNIQNSKQESAEEAVVSDDDDLTISDETLDVVMDDMSNELVVDEDEELQNPTQEARYEDLEITEDEEVVLTSELLAELSVVEVKIVRGLQRFGNYEPFNAEVELADVPSYTSVVPDAEVLYSGVLESYPTITAYITDIQPQDIYEPYFEALRRCGFTDLKIPKFFGYMADGKLHSVYLKSANVTLVNKEGSMTQLGKMTVVLINYAAPADVKDRTKAFIGHDIGEFDDLMVMYDE